MVSTLAVALILVVVYLCMRKLLDGEYLPVALIQVVVYLCMRKLLDGEYSSCSIDTSSSLLAYA